MVALYAATGYRVIDKMLSLISRPQSILKYDHKMPISWTKVLIFGLAGSPESPLSNEV